LSKQTQTITLSIALLIALSILMPIPRKIAPNTVRWLKHWQR
jgi:hypothetical protein